MSLLSFTPKTWHKFWKTMPEMTRSKLDCMKCGGLVKPKRKGNYTRRKLLGRGAPSAPLVGCAVPRILTQSDEYIIAFYSRVAEHFHLYHDKIGMSFLRRSLKCSLVRKHKNKVGLVVSQWGRNYGFPMTSEERPRIFRSDVPFRIWPCVRDGGCCWEADGSQSTIGLRAAPAAALPGRKGDGGTATEPNELRESRDWPPPTQPAADGGPPPPLLIVYWLMSDPKQKRLKTKIQALLEQHPGLEEKTVRALVKEMAERNMVEVSDGGMLVHKSLGKRWIAFRLLEIKKLLREYEKSQSQPSSKIDPVDPKKVLKEHRAEEKRREVALAKIEERLKEVEERTHLRRGAPARGRDVMKAMLRSEAPSKRKKKRVNAKIAAAEIHRLIYQRHALRHGATSLKDMNERELAESFLGEGTKERIGRDVARIIIKETFRYGRSQRLEALQASDAKRKERRRVAEENAKRKQKHRKSVTEGFLPNDEDKSATPHV